MVAVPPFPSSHRLLIFVSIRFESMKLVYGTKTTAAPATSRLHGDPTAVIGTSGGKLASQFWDQGNEHPLVREFGEGEGHTGHTKKGKRKSEAAPRPCDVRTAWARRGLQPGGGQKEECRTSSVWLLVMEPWVRLAC